VPKKGSSAVRTLGNKKLFGKATTILHRIITEGSLKAGDHIVRRLALSSQVRGNKRDNHVPVDRDVLSGPVRRMLSWAS